MRSVGAANQSAIEGRHIEPVILVKVEADEPAYVHSGVGVITYNGDEYIGVGQLGQVTSPKEDELVNPLSITLTLNGINPVFVAYSLTATGYGDAVTIYEGYRQDDGTLVADPYVVYSGWVDQVAVEAGPECKVSLTLQHDIAMLDEIRGDRCTDEDQQAKYPGDTFFSKIADIPTLRLLWGGGPTVTGWRGSGRARRPRR